MDQHYSQLCWYQSPTTVHLHIAPGADVLNVYWDTGILFRWGGRSEGGEVRGRGERGEVREEKWGGEVRGERWGGRGNGGGEGEEVREERWGRRGEGGEVRRKRWGRRGETMLVWKVERWQSYLHASYSSDGVFFHERDQFTLTEVAGRRSHVLWQLQLWEDRKRRKGKIYCVERRKKEASTDIYHFPSLLPFLPYFLLTLLLDIKQKCQPDSPW